MNLNLERFIKAQEYDYDHALKEIKNGRKLTHWMWYIFPQITGLGMSATAKYYEIKNIEETKAYLNNEILGPRLIAITKVLLELNTSDPVEIFGDIDALKLKSSMSLFYSISGNELFKKVIEKYFSNDMDDKTLIILERLKENK